MHSIAILSTLFAAGALASPAHDVHARLHRRQNDVQMVAETQVETAVVTVTAGGADAAPTQASNEEVVPILATFTSVSGAPAVTPGSSFAAAPTASIASAVSSAASAGSSAAASTGNQWVDLHNMYRAIHGAAPMTWNETSAGIAQQYGCAGGDKQVGSNWAGGTDMDVSACMWAWYSEESTYAGQTNNYQTAPSGSGDGGHFSQLVWDESTTVGCYQATGCGDYSNQFTCIYYPIGNFVDNESANQAYTSNVFAPSSSDASSALTAN